MRPRAAASSSTSSSTASSPAFRPASGPTASARPRLGLGDTQSIDPDIQQPTVLRANLGLQGAVQLRRAGFFSGWRFNLDYIYSRYYNPYTIVDLSQTTAITGIAGAGLNGFTIDGRPIYRAIDPTVAGCTAQLVDASATPVWAERQRGLLQHRPRRRADADQFGRLPQPRRLVPAVEGLRRRPLHRRAAACRSISAIPTPNAQDRRNMFNSTAGSNYDLTAAFDRQNPRRVAGLLREPAQHHRLDAASASSSSANMTPASASPSSPARAGPTA